LHELGWVRGQNLIAEERWAEGRNERLPELMAEVLGHKIDVLFTWTTPAAMAAKSATSTTPIVDGLMGDPVGTGLAASLAHPGGNLTGLSIAWSEGMAGKWLELLHEMVPRMSTVAVIVNPDRPISRAQAKRLEAAAPARDLKVHVVAVPGMRELDRAFGEAARTAQAVLVIDDPNLNPQRQRVVALAAKYRLPDMHVDRYFVEAGGLMSYAPDFAALFRRAADYVDKILKGAQAAELPIEEPTQYQLIVNLKTAKALGITIPESILLRADEVIR
jgi:putative ABC transport system substrate-binding protein